MVEWFFLWVLICLPLAVVDRSTFTKKCDAPLIFRLSAAVKAHDNQKKISEIRVVGVCELPITARLRDVLCDSGVTFLTITGNSFIAKGSASQISNLAEFRLVKSLRLSLMQVPDSDPGKLPQASHEQ